MKRWYYIVLGGILVVGVIYIYLHRQDLGISVPFSSGSEPGANADLRPAHIDWVKVDRSFQGFTVDMPSGTSEIEVPAYNQQGAAEQVTMIYSYPDAETSFSVSWEDNPPVMQASGGSADLTLDMARDDALTRSQCRLVSESRTTLDGYPVRDFVGRNESGGVFNARLILVGQRLYLLMSAFPSVTARRDSDVTRFFNSFHLVSSTNND